MPGQRLTRTTPIEFAMQATDQAGDTAYVAPPQDFFARDSCAFSGCVTASDRGPTVICYNDVDIPCRSELYTSDRVNASLLVVGLVDPGWSKVKLDARGALWASREPR